MTPVAIDERPHDVINRAYVDAVAAADGLPVLLPILDPVVVHDALDLVDALVRSGGGDVDPRRYGQEPGEHIDGVDDRRDAWELALIGAALEREVPILGICRGAQVLNVACGGTLLQDLAHVTEAMHRDAERYGEVVHPVELDLDSRVVEIMGGPIVGVNTLHHQAVDAVGQGLRPVGWSADDRTIEAIESDHGAPVVGVQWHPELLAHHESHHALFVWIVAQGSGRRGRGGTARLVA